MSAHGGDDGLQFVAALAVHAHFIALNLRRHLELAVADESIHCGTLGLVQTVNAGKFLTQLNRLRIKKFRTVPCWSCSSGLERINKAGVGLLVSQISGGQAISHILSEPAVGDFGGDKGTP